jgi:hypothetical protein
MAGSAGDGRHASLATATDGEVAAAEALASLRFGEAPRVGLLGDPGCGKTDAGRRLVNAYLRSCAGVVLVCDDKPEQQYPGPVRRSVEDLRARPTTASDGRVIVFKPDPFSRAENDPESIADLQWKLATRRQPSMVVYDELDRAAAHGQWKKGKDSFIAWALGKGRSAGAATLWGTQLTEKVPAEAFDCSSAILCFRMVGNPVRLLKQRGYCEGGAEKIIPRLPGDELPPQQRGYFVLLRRGRPWDNRVYRFSAPK